MVTIITKSNLESFLNYYQNKKNVTNFEKLFTSSNSTPNLVKRASLFPLFLSDLIAKFKPHEYNL